MQPASQSTQSQSGVSQRGAVDLPCDHGCAAEYEPELLTDLPEEILATRPGRGIPFPDALEGLRVAVLNAGAGFDCLALATLVGPRGSVIGIEPEAHQREMALRNRDVVAKRRGSAAPRVDFVPWEGGPLPIESSSVDVVLSNCALARWSDPLLMVEELRRILVKGGEFFLSEVVAERRVSRRIQLSTRHKACLTKALYTGDLRRVLQRAGFPDVRTVWSARVEKLDLIQYRTVVMRGFNLPLEDRCEDYGQSVIYLGTLPGRSTEVVFDQGHVFRTGEVVRVCKNTADMIQSTRFASHFEVSALGLHAGEFDCAPGTSGPAASDDGPVVGACGPGCC